MDLLFPEWPRHRKSFSEATMFLADSECFWFITLILLGNPSNRKSSAVQYISPQSLLEFKETQFQWMLDIGNISAMTCRIHTDRTREVCQHLVVENFSWSIKADDNLSGLQPIRCLYNFFDNEIAYSSTHAKIIWIPYLGVPRIYIGIDQAGSVLAAYTAVISRGRQVLFFFRMMTHVVWYCQASLRVAGCVVKGRQWYLSC